MWMVRAMGQRASSRGALLGEGGDRPPAGHRACVGPATAGRVLLLLHAPALGGMGTKLGASMHLASVPHSSSSLDSLLTRAT